MSKPPTPVLVHVGDFEPDHLASIEDCSRGGVGWSDARRQFPKGVVFTYEPRDFDDAKQVVRTPHET